MFDSLRAILCGPTSCPLRDYALGLFEGWVDQFLYQSQPLPQTRADIAMYQRVRVWNTPKIINWVGWRTNFNKEVEYMRVTLNANNQPTCPYHGVKLDGAQLGKHVGRCEHIRADKELTIQANPPSGYIRRAVNFVRSITSSQYSSRNPNPGAQDVGDYTQYYMRPELHREMAKRVDCLFLRLSCL